MKIIENNEKNENYQNLTKDEKLELNKLIKRTSKDELNKMIKNSELSKSFRMRELFVNLYDVKTISELLHVRYNFVYNIISRFCLEKRINEKFIEKNKNSESNLKLEIIELLKVNKNLKVSEISTKLNKNYNYCWKIMKELKNSK